MIVHVLACPFRTIFTGRDPSSVIPLTSVPPAAVALDSMLQEIAELNEAEVNAAVARTLLLLESIMIVLLRVIEIYLPILDPIKWVAR